MSNAKPERIYLTDETGETTWCQDKITDEDTEYIRADLVHLPDTPDQGLRDIESDPKDGTRFLFSNGIDVVGTGWFLRGHFAADSWQGSKHPQATHRKPLPSQPQENKP